MSSVPTSVPGGTISSIRLDDLVGERDVDAAEQVLKRSIVRGPMIALVTPG